MEIEKKYAIVEIKSGLQEKVFEGENILVPGNIGEEGKEVVFERVMFYRDGNNVKIGEPILKDVKVTGKILQLTKGEKVRVFKIHSKKNYRRRIGARSVFTEVKIEKIN